MYKLASLLLSVSALVHLATTVLGEFSSSVLIYAPFGVFFLLLAVALFRQKRWAAWLGFLLLLIGISVAVAGLNSYTVPNTFFYAMMVLNITAFLTLLITLWRHGHTV